MNKSSKVNLGSSVLGQENEYFSWLCLKIDRRQKYESRELALLLHSLQFRPLIPNDDNRQTDGMMLREYFCRDHNQDYECMMSDPCTVLEMLVALAIRIEGIMRENGRDLTAKWFWEMVDNLNLGRASDPRSRRVIEDFVDRDYSPNGKGGLFPLRRPREDQRIVEIWYQAQAYLAENYPD